MISRSWPEDLRQREYTGLFSEAFDAGRLTDFDEIRLPVARRIDILI